jgi:hypothetical protein
LKKGTGSELPGENRAKDGGREVQLVALLGDHEHSVLGILAGRLLHDGVVQVRIERHVMGLDAAAVVPAEDVLQLAVDHLEPFQQGIGVGVFLRGGNRPLDVVQRRQQVAQQPEVGIAEAFFGFAGGPLAVVLQFGVAAQGAVFGGFQLGAELRRVLFGRLRLRSVFRLRFRNAFRFRVRSIRSRFNRLVFRHASFSAGLVPLRTVPSPFQRSPSASD